MKLKYYITVLLLIAVCSLRPAAAHAQCDIGTIDLSDPDSGCGSTDTGVPFDSGVYVLIAAGVAYGLKKRYDYSKQIVNE